MPTKLELFNQITQETRIVDYSSCHRSSFDLVTKVITDSVQVSSYRSKRADALLTIVDKYIEQDNISGKSYVRDQINDFKVIQNQYFTHNRGYPNSTELSKALSNEPVGNVNEATDALISYFSRVIEKMSVEHFKSFIEMSYNMEPFVVLAIQPAIIMTLGYATYAVVQHILYGKFGSLLSLLKRSINSLHRHSLRNSVSSISFYIQSIFGRGSIFRSTFVSFSVVSIGYLAYNTFLVDSSIVNKRVFTPQRIGGSTSEFVDKVSGTLEKIGSEVATLAGSFTKGFITAILATYENSLRPKSK